MSGDALRHDGIEVALLPPHEAMRATGFDGAIIGGVWKKPRELSTPAG